MSISKKPSPISKEMKKKTGKNKNCRRQKSSSSASAVKIKLQPHDVQQGLSKLVMILLKLIHELLERQAIRRMDKGNLSNKQIDRMGLTLMKQAEEINRLRDILGLKEEDLDLNLGPLGKIL